MKIFIEGPVRTRLAYEDRCLSSAAVRWIDGKYIQIIAPTHNGRDSVFWIELNRADLDLIQNTIDQTQKVEQECRSSWATAADDYKRRMN